MGTCITPAYPDPYTTGEDYPYAVPRYNYTLASPCQADGTGEAIYWNSACDSNGCLMVCGNDHVWYPMHLAGCPSTDVCSAAIIIQSVPYQIAINRTQLANGTEVLTFFSPVITPEITFPIIGSFLLPDGSLIFNASYLRQPVMNIEITNANGNSSDPVFMHNNISVTCNSPFYCNVTASQSQGEVANFTNYQLDLGVNALPLWCGTNLICGNGSVLVQEPPISPLACEYYVDKGGSDSSGTGSVVNPWLTITYLISKIDSSGCSSAVAYFGSGTWSEDWVGTSTVPFSLVGTEGTIFSGLYTPGSATNPAFFYITFTENQGFTTALSHTFTGCTLSGMLFAGSGSSLPTITYVDCAVTYQTVTNAKFYARQSLLGPADFEFTSDYTNAGDIVHYLYGCQYISTYPFVVFAQGTISTNTIYLIQSTLVGPLSLVGNNTHAYATPGAYNPNTLILTSGASAPTVYAAAGIVPYFSVDGGTAHDGVKLNLKSGSGVTVTDEGSGDVRFSIPGGPVTVATAGPETLDYTDGALNLTVNGQSYYIPAGISGLQQGQTSFTTSFRWGLLESGPVEVSLSAIGQRVTVYVAPFGFDSAGAAGCQALVVAQDPLPIGFIGQLGGGLQVGQSVGFYDFVNYQPTSAFPYVNYYNRLVFSSSSAYFPGETAGRSALSSFGGVTYSYLLSASGMPTVNCTGVHWEVVNSFVDMGDVHVSGSPSFASVTVNVTNDGQGTVSNLDYRFRGGSATVGPWAAFPVFGTCSSGTIAPGASCPVTVTFTPVADGYFGATLTLSYKCFASTVGGVAAGEVAFVGNGIGVPATTPPPTSPPPSTFRPTPGPGGPAFYYTCNYGPCCGGNRAIVFEPTWVPSDPRTVLPQYFWFTIGYQLTSNFTEVTTSIYGSDAAYFHQQDPRVDCPYCTSSLVTHCDFLPQQTLVPIPKAGTNESNTCWVAMWFAAPTDASYTAYFQLAGVYQGVFTQLTWTLTGQGSFLAPSGGEKPSWGAWAVSIITTGAGDDGRSPRASTTGGRAPQQLKGESGADAEEREKGGHGSRKEINK